MSIASFNQFQNEVMQDETLQQKLVAAPDKEQLSRLAVEPGRNLSLEFNEAEVLDSDYSGELDESELDAVAGGCWNENYYNNPINVRDDMVGRAQARVVPRGFKMNPEVIF